MLVSIKRTGEFIPEWNGNKTQAQPVTVHHKFPTTDERDRYIYWSRPVLESSQEGQARSKVERVIDRRGMFLGLITKIDNLEVEESGKAKKIETAKDLLETPGLTDLYEEIVAHLISASAAVELKN